MQVKAASVREQEQGSRRLTTGDSFGNSLGAKVIAARELGKHPECSAIHKLRSVD